MSSEAILVGHSLENDLRAVRVVHPRVLDTSVSFPHPKGLPWRSALRVITEKILKRKIQVGAHDSAEDARAAMDLALAKIQNGPDFGTSNQGDQDREHVVDILAESGRRAAAVDRPDNLRRIVSGTCSAVPVESDGEAVEKTKKALGTGEGGGMGRTVEPSLERRDHPFLYGVKRGVSPHQRVFVFVLSHNIYLCHIT